MIEFESNDILIHLVEFRMRTIVIGVLTPLNRTLCIEMIKISLYSDSLE